MSAVVSARTRARHAAVCAVLAETGGGSISRISWAYRSSSVPSGPREPRTRSAAIFCRSSSRSVCVEAITRRSRSHAELLSQRGLAVPSGLSAGTM